MLINFSFLFLFHLLLLCWFLRVSIKKSWLLVRGKYPHPSITMLMCRRLHVKRQAYVKNCGQRKKKNQGKHAGKHAGKLISF